MITAIDTNILLDLIIPDSNDQTESTERLDRAASQGAMIINEAVYAELAAHSDQSVIAGMLVRTGIRLEASNSRALRAAGEAWRQYSQRRPDGLTCPHCGSRQQVACSNCGAPMRNRQHILSDFLIGAHASVQADGLITRDRGYFARYFPDLTLL